MIRLINKDFQANNWSVYIGVIVFIFISYLVTIPPTVIFLLSTFAIVFSAYSHDDKNSVNRFLLSMPIVKEDIVKSRYVYSVTIAIGTLLIQLIMMNIISFFFETNLYMYTWQDVMTLIGMVGVMIAIFSPILYLFRSITNAMFFICFLIGVGTVLLMNELERVLPFTNTIVFNDIDAGFALLVERYFPAPAYIVFILFSSLLMYLSFLLSIYLFKQRDV
ncbi:MAG TPA: ABC-2 transporter permease [Pseudogracilibacillus sp.]|nr:ABC-2 transporter permease [Pseudogracilibacillus sp.]